MNLARSFSKRWRRLRSGCVDLWMWSGLQARVPPPPATPPPDTSRIVNGFDRAIGVAELHEGCRRLGLAVAGDPLVSVTAIGTEAVATDGSRSWVKVSALAGEMAHRFRQGELFQLRGVRKPHVIATSEWSVGERHFLALQMTLAPSPIVEAYVWAGPSALGMSDAWFADLKQALEALGTVATDRHRNSPEEVAETIHRFFGPDAPARADEWCVAHGDLHWGNVTAPELLLLDWQFWGSAPRGFDAGVSHRGVLLVSGTGVANRAAFRRHARDTVGPGGAAFRAGIHARLRRGWLGEPGLSGAIAGSGQARAGEVLGKLSVMWASLAVGLTLTRIGASKVDRVEGVERSK